MDGRMIKEGGKDVCVISAELADKNQLEIGSRISFGNCRNKEDPMVYEATTHLQGRYTDPHPRPQCG